MSAVNRKAKVTDGGDSGERQNGEFSVQSKGQVVGIIKGEVRFLNKLLKQRQKQDISLDWANANCY